LPRASGTLPSTRGLALPKNRRGVWHSNKYVVSDSPQAGFYHRYFLHLFTLHSSIISLPLAAAWRSRILTLTVLACVCQSTGNNNSIVHSIREQVLSGAMTSRYDDDCNDTTSSSTQHTCECTDTYMRRKKEMLIIP
jgi:hypothetical protein